MWSFMCIRNCRAVYCLILFYHELRHDMARIKPLAKFLCIKVRAGGF